MAIQTPRRLRGLNVWYGQMEGSRQLAYFGVVRWISHPIRLTKSASGLQMKIGVQGLSVFSNDWLHSTAPMGSSPGRVALPFFKMTRLTLGAGRYKRSSLDTSAHKNGFGTPSPTLIFLP
jgi:hypothetical protein